jgi:hypothetical protein
MPTPQTDGEGTFLLDAAMKAQQWERAKGELRALIAIQGSYSLGRGPGDDRPAKWQRLQVRVDEFIQSVEDDALQE